MYLGKHMCVTDEITRDNDLNNNDNNIWNTEKFAPFNFTLYKKQFISNSCLKWEFGSKDFFAS